MQKYLEEVYHGNINPHEGRFPRDPSCKLKLEEACQLEELLLDGLSESKKKYTISFNLPV